MNETVAVNGLTLCHKNSDGWVRSTLPDVCKTPKVPVPFTNVAFAKDLAKGTKTVFSHGGAMNGIKGSEFSVSIGDEPGVGGGIKSGVNKHRATFLSWSPNVFMEGRPATRLTDRMLLNKGNTISAGGYYTKPPKNFANKDLLDKLCGYICECIRLMTATQRCVELQILAEPENAANGIIPEQGYQRVPGLSAPGSWQLYLGPGAPKGIGVPGVVRPDISDIGHAQGVTPRTLVEVKFPTDRYRGTQRADYESIAQWYGATLEDIDLGTEHGRTPDCECAEEQKEQQREPVHSPGTDTVPSPTPDVPPVFVPPPRPRGRRIPCPRGGLPGAVCRLIDQVL